MKKKLLNKLKIQDKSNKELSLLQDIRDKMDEKKISEINEQLDNLQFHKRQEINNQIEIPLKK